MDDDTFDTSHQAYANGYYGDKFKEGLVYQDFATRELYKRGIVLVGYASRSNSGVLRNAWKSASNTERQSFLDWLDRGAP